MHTILHPATEKEFGLLVQSHPHALLVTGPRGIGLTQVAKEFAREIGAVQVQVEPREGTIGVEQIREVYQTTRGRKSSPHVFSITGESLTTQAQHAFLKLLEEPPAHTIFVITSHNPALLLETVRSRMQTLIVRPLSETQSHQLIDASSTPIQAKQRAQLLFLSSGLPAELTRLMSDTGYFEQRVAHMQQAQRYIVSSRYERLSLLHLYMNNRSELEAYIQAIAKLLHHDVYQKTQMTQQHSELLERLEKANEAIRLNGNLKLIAAQLVL